MHAHAPVVAGLDVEPAAVVRLVDHEPDRSGSVHPHRDRAIGRGGLDVEAAHQARRVAVRARLLPVRSDVPPASGAVGAALALKRHELEHAVVADPRARLVRQLDRLEAAALGVVVDERAVRPARLTGIRRRHHEVEPVRHGRRGHGVAAREARAGVAAAARVDALGGGVGDARGALGHADLDEPGGLGRQRPRRGIVQRGVAEHDLDVRDAAARPRSQ